MRIADRGLPGASLIFALLLSAGWAGDAAAVDVIYQGPPGSNGSSGVSPGVAGGDGQPAPPVVQVVTSTDPVNTLQVAGGDGGMGGDGAAGNSSVNGGAAGAGGAGAPTTATLNMTSSAASGKLNVSATGGRGGNSGQPGAAGPGTAAGVEASAGAGGTARATANLTNSGSSTLDLSALAAGGNGGDTMLGTSGRGGDAWSEVSVPDLNGAQTVSITSTASGGSGGAGFFDPGGGPSATAAAGGSANSKVTLASAIPLSGGWNAVISGSSTASGGLPTPSIFQPDGSAADADINLQAYGKVTAGATATGSSGGGNGGIGTAHANASSNYMAMSSAMANGGGSFFNPGADANAHAVASSAYFASADAVANAGVGHAGSTGTATATAEATVTRGGGSMAPPSPQGPSEARAHALGSTPGSNVLARSSYIDSSHGVSVVTAASNSAQFSQSPTEAFSAANVGGGAYTAWQGPTGNPVSAISYASAMPTAASVATLLSTAPVVKAAFNGVTTLGAGTMGALFMPSNNTAEFNLPFSSGQHLLLGLASSFMMDDPLAFTFSIANNGTALYAGSYTSNAQAAATFNDHVLDLGVINAPTLDLLITFSLIQGGYGFAYLLGQGNAAAVPEPGLYLLFLAGLGTVLLLAIRKSPMAAVDTYSPDVLIKT